MEKEKKKKKKKAISPRRRKIKFAFKVFILVLLLLILVAGIVFYFKYGKDIFRLQAQAKEIVAESTVDTFKKDQTSLVYDANGDVIAKLKGSKDINYLSIDEIPAYVKQAVISIEDKSFASHGGIDLSANVRAMLSLIKHKGQITQGASTITQQLSRNIFLNFDKTWERKVKEIFVSVELEKKYTKMQILEFYLNNIYFANGYYGIQAASRGYFSKDVGELSLSQIAFLVSIPNNPTLYNPTEKMENTLSRRNRILKQMFDDQKISQSQYDQAVAEKITLNREKIETQSSVDSYVLFAATEAIMEVNGFQFKNKFDSNEDRDEYNTAYEEQYTEAQHDLYSKGYSIYTSIKPDIQSTLQSTIDDKLSKFTDKSDEGIYKMQSAAVCIDNKTGRVVAIVGGRSQDGVTSFLNRAYQAYRQPGSSIKPLIDYLPALQGGYNADSIVDDKDLGKGKPANADRTYMGKITLRVAVEKSRNTVAYQLFEELTPYVCMSNLYNMNFKKLDKNDYLGTASIGGFTNGVSPLEMAAAYSTIANQGKYRKGTCIVKITDSEGKEVVSDTINEKQVYEANACNEMTNIMEGVLTKGTGRGFKLNNMSCAGKTGTTNANKDGWFVGYTPYYTTSVWVGNDIPKAMNGVTGNTYPLYIWNKFMTEVNKGLPNIGFPSYTSSPSKTPQATEEPEETPEPEATATEAPQETEKPKATKAPQATQKPEGWEGWGDDDNINIDIPQPATQKPSQESTKPNKPNKPSTGEHENPDNNADGEAAPQQNQNQ